MPWSVGNLPPSVSKMNLTDKEKKLFVSVANSVLKDTGDEGRAIASGISAVKKSRKKSDDDLIEEIKRKSEVQSVVFSKSKFSKEKAVSWLKEHSMRYNTSRETENEIRFRQTDPKKYSEFRSKNVSSGVRFILGIISGKENNLDYESKSLNFDFKNFNDEDGSFEGYASFFGNVDSYNDMVVKGAFIESLKKRKPKLLWQHKTDMPIGVYDYVKEHENCLYVKGRLAIKTDMGRNAYELLKMKALDGLSIGYKVKDYDYDTMSIDGKDEKVRRLKEVDLFEVSIVTFGANKEALINQVKNEEIENFKSLREIELYLRNKHSFSKRSAETLISKITEFKKLHWDNEKVDDDVVSQKCDTKQESINKLKNTLLEANIYLLTKEIN